MRDWTDSRKNIARKERIAQNKGYKLRDSVQEQQVAKKTSTHFDDWELIHFIGQFPEGISVDGLMQKLPNPGSKRTLQYHLASLVKRGTVLRTGKGKGTKYLLKEKLPKKPALATTQEVIPLSDRAKELRTHIRLPIQQRKPVSYNFDFLHSYQPNQSTYLDETVTRKLHAIGDHSEKGRPAGTYAKQIYHRLLIDLSWNSSRLEGNTYSLLETERLLETGEAAIGKNPIETQMILNHKAAIEFLVDHAASIDVHRYTILNLHGFLSHHLLRDPKACGRLRTLPVKIGKSVYHPLEIPHLIEEAFQTLIEKAQRIENPFEQSFFLMVHLPYLQPFMDVNKRVARLAGNIPFIRNNLCPLSFIDVPESDYIESLLAIYELNRIDYFRDVFVWAYERSASLYSAARQALGEPDPMRIQYRDLLQEAVQLVVRQQLGKPQAVEALHRIIRTRIPHSDQDRFQEIVEVELNSLHEGNFARYHLSPEDFFRWQKIW